MTADSPSTAGAPARVIRALKLLTVAWTLVTLIALISGWRPAILGAVVVPGLLALGIGAGLASARPRRPSPPAALPVERAPALPTSPPTPPPADPIPRPPVAAARLAVVDLEGYPSRPDDEVQCPHCGNVFVSPSPRHRCAVCGTDWRRPPLGGSEPDVIIRSWLHNGGSDDVHAKH